MLQQLKYTLFTATLLFSVPTACAQVSSETKVSKEPTASPEVIATQTSFELADFYSNSAQLDAFVERVFEQLNASQKVAQLIMPAMGKYGQAKHIIDELVKDELIGGILMLNGTKDEFQSWVSEYNTFNNEHKRLPFLYSADAEPSLINRKILNTTPVAKANTLKNKTAVMETANLIASELNSIGINYNFAPVVDMSPNKTVGWRSFGHAPDSVIPWSNAFIQATQNNQIIATAKHFPGHGYVIGDTHEKLVFIDGAMREVNNYPPLIEDGVLSIMIAHIAVKNNPKYNTNGFPATTSREIVTDLLRDSLGFEGLIVTDALNMGGVKNVTHANLLAVNAGCDILLMPLDARKAHQEVLQAYNSDELTKIEVDASAKRIIRMKICLGLIPFSN